MSEEKKEAVNQPAHYTFGKYEVIEVLQDWFPTQPLLWQVGKYIARAKYKGKYLEDLKKARFYLERAIKEEENKEPQSPTYDDTVGKELRGLKAHVDRLTQKEKQELKESVMPSTWTLFI